MLPERQRQIPGLLRQHVHAHGEPKHEPDEIGSAHRQPECESDASAERKPKREPERKPESSDSCPNAEPDNRAVVRQPPAVRGHARRGARV